MLSIRSVGGAFAAGSADQHITLGTYTASADALRSVPFYLPKPATVSEIGIKVTTAVAGAIRIGIYADKGEPVLYPYKLLLDAGTVNTGTTGMKSIAIKKDLPRGLVWLTLIGNSAPTIANITLGSWMPLGYPDDPASGPRSYYSKGYTYGALPDPFPDGATMGNLPVYVYLKFA
jgi:hypothetical protein